MSAPHQQQLQQQQQRSEGRLKTLARHILAPDDACQHHQQHHQVCDVPGMA
jgi:hypothetical protein